MSSNSSHTIFIDDADTSKIQYQTIQLGPYRGKGFTQYTGVSTDDNAGPIYDGTLSITTVEDVSAAVTFTGTRVSLWGSIRPPLMGDVPLPLTKYSIPEWDYGGIPAMIPYQAPNVTSPQNNVNFFTSDVLPYGTYTLTINVTVAGPTAPFYLDYIAVEVPGPAPSSSAPPSSSQLTMSTTTPPPAAAFTQESHRHIGLIVGGVLGGVLVLLGTLFVFLYYLKRKDRMMSPEYKYDNCTTAQKDSSLHVIPFVDSERGVSILQPGDVGLMFVPARSSMGSQPSSSRPNSPPPSAPYYHPCPVTPPVSTPSLPYSKSRAISPSSQSDERSNSPGVRTHKRSMTLQSIGDVIDRSSTPSAGMADTHPVIPVNRAQEIPEDEELPPVYSRTPLPGENYSTENVSAVHRSSIAANPAGAVGSDRATLGKR